MSIFSLLKNFLNSFTVFIWILAYSMFQSPHSSHTSLIYLIHIIKIFFLPKQCFPPSLQLNFASQNHPCIVILIFLSILVANFPFTWKKYRLQIWYGSCMVSSEMPAPSSFLFYYSCVIFLRPRAHHSNCFRKKDGKRPRAKRMLSSWTSSS